MKNYFAKQTLNLLFLTSFLIVLPFNAHARDEKKAANTNQKTSVAQVSDADLRALILELYAQAQKDGNAENLPKDFKTVYSALEKGSIVSRGALEQAFLSLGQSLETSRAPRPDAPKSTSLPVGPGCCCDIPVVKPQPIIIQECCPMIEEHCPTILKPSDILPNGYTITIPGYYTLCGSVGFSAPGTPTCVINIQTSNVTLDLNQQTIYQTNGNAGLVGVCVGAGFDNIVIKSGKISGVTGDGIDIANGSESIVISDVTVQGCGGAGISFSGIAGSVNRDVTIENSRFTSNGGNGGTFTFTEKVKISDSKFNDNVVIGAAFSSSNGNEIDNSTFNKNGGAGNAIGLSLNATGSSIVRDCVFNANFSTTGTARGLLLTSTGNLVDNCVADGNTTSVSAGFAIGFDVDGTAHLLKNCSASGNSAVAGGGSIGVGLRVVSTAFRCLVKNSTALTNSARGFEHDATPTYNIFIGNFSFGHGSNTGNYFGSGLGFMTVGAGAQPPAGSFDERGVSNISVI
jgi:hypothetical protein